MLSNALTRPVDVCVAVCLVGAGMLGLPHAMATTGYILGVLLLFSAAGASAFALHLLSVSAMKVGVEPSSFYVVASRAVPRATWLIDLAVAIKCFGVVRQHTPQHTAQCNDACRYCCCMHCLSHPFSRVPSPLLVGTCVWAPVVVLGHEFPRRDW